LRSRHRKKYWGFPPGEGSPGGKIRDREQAARQRKGLHGGRDKWKWGNNFFVWDLEEIIFLLVAEGELNAERKDVWSRGIHAGGAFRKGGGELTLRGI